MTDDTVSRLLDEAVPGIPDELRRPRLHEVRTRVRHRRARRNAVLAAAVTAVLLTGPALWYQSTRGEAQRPPSGGEVIPSTTAAAVDSKVTWWMAHLDRNGTRVTLYATRPPDSSDGPPCEGVWHLEAGASMAPDAATVVVEDASAGGLGCPEDESDSMTPVRVTLPEPLGNRTLVDGYDGSPRPVYREADLPKVPDGPDGWKEVPSRFSTGHPAPSGHPGTWYVGYTRPGGPDIRIEGYPPFEAPTVDADPIDTVDVEGARGTIHPHPSEDFGYELRWEASGVVYFLELSPTEGERISEAQFREVLNLLGIS